jgi:peptidoglycan/xylan/chitin deacetylase (PgdA/CDA1 family)
MNLKIGVLGGHAGWHILLQQIGVPHSIVTDSLLPDDFSIVVVSDMVDDRESEMLRQYLWLGGAVLCSVKVYARIRQITAQLGHIDYLYPGPSSVFHSLGIVDIYARCQLAWNANELKTNRGSFAAHVGTRGDDLVIALPFDPAEMVTDRRAAVKSFYSPERRLPFETVSRVSKGEIRSLVLRCLELLHHRRGLPFVHLWNFPDGARSLFCFRIDTDSGTDEQLKDLSLVVQRNEIPATWFVDVKNHAQSIKEYVDMNEQEIGVHCFNHETYPDYERNVQNIRKAQELLRNSGIRLQGFAAPFGTWNDELGRAILDCGFEYSSEFLYDYDNLPSLPHLQNGDGVLQVPIHPICIGNLKQNDYTSEQMIRYFASVIERKIAVHEPIIFYHHPRDMHLDVLEWLLNEMRFVKVPVKTMGEYAWWWKMRTASIPELQYATGKVRLQGVRPEKSLYVRLSQPNGTEAIIPMSEQIVLETVRWEPRSAAWTMPDDYLRTRRFNYRIPLVRGVNAAMNYIQKKKA